MAVTKSLSSNIFSQSPMFSVLKEREFDRVTTSLNCVCSHTSALVGKPCALSADVLFKC